MEQKNTCILSHGSIQNDGRVLKIIDFFLSKGHLVVVLFPSDDPFNELETLKKGGLRLKPQNKRNSFWRKVLRHTAYPLEFNYLASEAAKFDQKFDYIYVNDLPSLFAGLMIKKNNPSSQLIYDSHEIFNETVNQFFPAESGALKSFVFKILIKTMRWFGISLENKMVKNVDLFVTVNESLKEYFEKKYRITGVQVMMNCPSRQILLTAKDYMVDFRAKYEWQSDSKIFLYQGCLNKGRGLELLVKTFNETPNYYKLVILGEGILKDSLEKLVTHYCLGDKVKFGGLVPHHLLPCFTKAADVGIVLLEPYNLNKALASPNKLFEYIHAGIPVICSDTPENRKVVNAFDIGVLTKNTENDLLNNLLQFSSFSQIKDRKLNLEAAANHYRWENQIIVLDKFLK